LHWKLLQQSPLLLQWWPFLPQFSVATCRSTPPALRCTVALAMAPATSNFIASRRDFLTKIRVQLSKWRPSTFCPFRLKLTMEGWRSSLGWREASVSALAPPPSTTPLASTRSLNAGFETPHVDQL
jgi:hypothetical protein